MKIQGIDSTFGFKGNENKNLTKKFKSPSCDTTVLRQYVPRYQDENLTSKIEAIKAEMKSEQRFSDPFLKPGCALGAQNSNVLSQKLGAMQKYKTNALDMEKIESIILPETQKANMRSFEDSDKKFTLDRYQKEAVDSFISGKSTIVTAPTGTGKTLIAEYGIEDALKKGEKIIYLSPLKALSNEKFIKFSELFGKYDDSGKFTGSDKVGIMTGDITLNPDAQLLVMTTEVYRDLVSMDDEITTAKDFKDYSGVIYDEFHYLKDPDRGTVWEESVMHTPKHMKQMMLSATASNAKEVQGWLEQINPTKSTALIDVPEDERYVPLKEYVYGFTPGKGNRIEQIFRPQINISKLNSGLSDRQEETVLELEKLYDGQNYKDILSPFIKDGLVDADTFATELVNKKGLSREKAEQTAYVLSDRSRTQMIDLKLDFANKNPSTVPLVKTLDKMDKTPALFFVFSKKKCKKDLDETAKKLGTLLKPEESKRVLDIVNEAKKNNIYLGKDFEKDYLPKLLMGFSVHHAGMLPAYKSLVERLAREGLIKACFATETLVAGINMPFKTVVFTSIKKFDGHKMIEVPPTVFKQGAGRAGRRGKDDIGNVIVMPTSSGELRDFKALMNSTDTKIKSAYNLSYSSLLQNSMLNNLDESLAKSFLVYQAGNNAEKIIKGAKHKIAYLKEKGFIKDNNGVNTLSQKGEMAKNIHGINQILFCELISNPKYTQDLTPEQLAALMVIFADVKDDRPRDIFDDNLADVAEKLAPSIELAKEISREQIQNKIDEPIKMSTNLVESILRFANAPKDDSNKCIETWNEIFNDLQSKYILAHEGDLLRVFNGTIDLLNNIVETAQDPELAHKAELAIESLKKPPVTDILKYELDI